MILVFRIGKEFLYVEVDQGRNIRFKSKLTNNKYVSYQEISGKSGQDKEQTVLVETIVRDLKEESDVEKYLRTEIMKGFQRDNKLMALGIKHVKTIV